VGRNVAIAVGALFLAWFVGNLALGPSTGGVDLNSNLTGELAVQPPCTAVHTYVGRGWAGHELVRSDVWLTGCKNPAGQMRILAGPTCEATSFLGAGTATCSSAPDGSDLSVTVTVHYPFGLDIVSGGPVTTTFRIDPGGGYNAP
jgi:hypothetical protein